MDDIRIPGIVASIFYGWVSGMMTIGVIGWKMFGPINGSSDTWGIIGGSIGIIFFVYTHFKRKRDRHRKGQMK